MTVHVLMPVFNRLVFTTAMLGLLREQKADEPLSITVVDDGSTDGTSQYLGEQADVTVLQGNGHLWWGGAIDLGLRHVLATARDEDWVVFVNNDASIGNGFIQALLDAARKYAPAAVGSVLRDVQAPHKLVSIGPCIDAGSLSVRDVFDERLSQPAPLASGVVGVDALSGRGVMYPVAALRTVKGMRAKWLPHYLADYELSLRVRSAGWRLIVSHDAVTYSDAEFGNLYRGGSWRERFFSVRSPSYLPAQIRFWWSASTALQKLSLPARLLFFSLFPKLRNGWKTR